ncbi:unnamed protein product [Moneuplotes crassus]|uniref:Fanconi-associated nuclease n=1 Tax=Euplotes crassus TaxID=5936 RepID=A0AAD1XCM6_EUPCR|nr:unnamed protein product [Moneuplotes crassus]
MNDRRQIKIRKYFDPSRKENRSTAHRGLGKQIRRSKEDKRRADLKKAAGKEGIMPIRSIRSYFTMGNKLDKVLESSEKVTETKDTENYQNLKEIEKQSEIVPEKSLEEIPTQVVRYSQKVEEEKMPLVKEEAKKLDPQTLNEIDDGFWFPFEITSNLRRTQETMATMNQLSEGEPLRKCFLYSDRGMNKGCKCYVETTTEFSQKYTEKAFIGNLYSNVGISLAKILDFGKCIVTAQFDTIEKQVHIKIDLQQPVLKNQRRNLTCSFSQSQTSETVGGVYNLENLAGLPKKIKWAFCDLNKFNKTKKKCLKTNMNGENAEYQMKSAKEILMIAQSAREEAKEAKSLQEYNESGINLVCRTVLGYSHLFTDEEKEILQNFSELDYLAQTLFTKMLFRKRVWFSSHNLKDYCKSPAQIRGSLKLLIKLGFVEKPKGLMKDLHQLRIFLESLSSKELTEFSKILGRKFNKYPPTVENTFPDFKGADMESPIVALSPFRNLSEIGKKCIDDLISGYVRMSKSNVKGASKFSKGKSMSDIVERIEAYKAYQSGNSKILAKSSTLHRFLISKQKPLQESEENPDNDFDTLVAEKLEPYYRIPEKIECLLKISLDLFYFYQVSDPHQAMALHEYGSYSYSIKESYLEVAKEGKLGESGYEHVYPLFKSREQFLAFNQLYQVRCYISHISDTKYTPVERGILAEVIALYSLEKQGFDPKVLRPENIRKEINEYIKKIVFDTEFKQDDEYWRKNAHKLFQTRFLPNSMLPMIDNKCSDFLEKGKKYELSVLLLLNLLFSRVKKHKRGKWWHRLSVNLNHIGMPVEAFCICYKALKDDKTINNGKRNYLVLYQKVLKRNIFKIFNERDKRIEKLEAKLTHKQFKRRIGKCEFEKEKQKIMDEYFLKFNILYKLELQSLFSEEYRYDWKDYKKQKEVERLLAPKWNFMEVTTEQKYRRSYFKERYLKCPRATGNNGENLGTIYLNHTNGKIYRVEDLALYYYCNKEGYYGIHSENGFGITLFGLFMWEQIFDNTVPGVFQSPYQFAPLDYGSNEFYFNREEKILKRLKKIKEMTPEELRDEIEILWETHKYKHNCAISWDSISFSKEKLKDIIPCMGGDILAKIVKKYCYDYKNWNHGMPDLLLWNPEEKKIKFSEVKSEFDKLSEVQKGWLEYLSQCGIHAEACYINRRGKEHCAIDAV